jgi:hypothetical protein
MAEKVTLLVYDITMGMAKGMSMMILGVQVDAVYHTSVVVYGREFFFGGGICESAVKQTPYGKPIQEIPIGETEIPREVFDDFCKDVAHKYSIDKYDVMDHNCNMFTAEIAEFLTGVPLDKKYANQAKELLDTPGGQMFKPFLTQMQGSIQNPPPGFFY